VGVWGDVGMGVWVSVGEGRCIAVREGIGASVARGVRVGGMVSEAIGKGSGRVGEAKTGDEGARRQAASRSVAAEPRQRDYAQPVAEQPIGYAAH